MLFWTGQQSIINPKDFELPDNQRYRTTAFVRNNEYDVKDYGYEIEWRSNFWWLPGLLNGLVLNVNYTRNISEGHYNEPRFISEYDENFNLILTNNDTTYTAPMIGQPDHLLNFIAGYDYKGFSIRYALRFKSNIFARNNYYEELRGYSTDFLRHDISMQQKLPLEGLELFFNFYNLTDEFEYDIINANSYTSQEEHYGQQIYLGIRFTFN